MNEISLTSFTLYRVAKKSNYQNIKNRIESF